ncbi:hypothetical protein [Curtobacterium sp. NPDC089689]|uniref:hypothetical protein n=1 Tax=Curtobacterium sp. NPDC089689 TaxID=3363968 RepID=UPI00382D81F3
MTDTVERAEQRWAAAEARALDVLALPAPRRFSVARATALLVLPAALVLVVGLVFPPDSTGRWAIAWTGLVAYTAVLVASLVLAARDRRRGRVSPPVTDVLLPREQDALRRVIRERERAPEDRLDVVRATALQRVRTASTVLPAAIVTIGAAAALVAGDLWALNAGWAVVGLGSGAISIRSASTAQRYLAHEAE